MKTVKTPTKPRLILKAHAYTPILKPLNGPIPRSNKSHMLKLGTITYHYEAKTGLKTAKSILYFIKGIRGALRHQATTLCYNNGLEVCHTSDKEVDKQGNPLIPQGYHKQGSCFPKKECVIHSIFGSFRRQGKISVNAHPITNIPHKTYKTNHDIQVVHIATENRICLNKDYKTIQHFTERYLSGCINFEIDVTQCTQVELGLLIETLMTLQRLGSGFNSGYGRIKVTKLQLIKKQIQKTLEWDSDGFTINENNNKKSLKKQVLEALKMWRTTCN